MGQKKYRRFAPNGETQKMASSSLQRGTTRPFGVPTRGGGSGSGGPPFPPVPPHGFKLLKKNLKRVGEPLSEPTKIKDGDGGGWPPPTPHPCGVGGGGRTAQSPSLGQGRLDPNPPEGLPGEKRSLTEDCPDVREAPGSQAGWWLGSTCSLGERGPARCRG